MNLPDSDLAKSELAQCAARHRPGLAEMSDKFIIKETYYVDDHLLSLDATHLSLRKFLRECLKEETRTDVHRYFLWSWVALAGLVLIFYKGYVRQDYKQRIVHL